MPKPEDHAESTSSDLLLQVIQGEDPAWERFVETYSPLLYSRCRARGIPPQDAADIVQDVLRRVIKSIGKFRRDQPGQGLRRWLRTIAGNVINDHFRKIATLYPEPAIQVSSELFSQLAEGSMSSGPDTDSDIRKSSSDTRSLREMLTLIQNDYETTTWEAFWRTAVEGQLSVDVAQDLNLSPGTVRQARYKILKRLRELL